MGKVIKILKILVLALIQTLVFSVLVYLSVEQFALHLASAENGSVGIGAAAIGVIGGADGPTAIFLASDFGPDRLLDFSVTIMFIAFITANALALLSRKVLSIVLVVISYLLASTFLMVWIGIMLWMPVILLIILAVLMFGGYYLMRRYK